MTTFAEIPRCDGRPFDADSITASTRVFAVDLGVGGTVRLTYHLTISVHVNYGTGKVLTFRFDTPEPFGTTVRRDEENGFDPAGRLDPHSLLLDKKTAVVQARPVPAPDHPQHRAADPHEPLSPRNSSWRNAGSTTRWRAGSAPRATSSSSGATG